MKIIENHTVTEEITELVRAADYILKEFSFFETKSGVKNALKKQRFRIDGQVCRTGTIIKTGQIIQLLEEKPTVRKVFKLKLPIIYEDDFIAVINKPAGISVSGNYFKTVQNALPYNLKKSDGKDALEIPLPVHRLDNQTSGLLLIAKTQQARIRLGKQFEEKQVKKTYYAVVVGTPPKKGKINFPVEDKYAFTEFECIRSEKSLRNGHLSLIKLFPHTGRTHQLRIHCEKSGFPILGDKLYHANLPVFIGKGLFLSATELAFSHPITNEVLKFALTVPEKFIKIIEREKRRYETS